MLIDMTIDDPHRPPPVTPGPSTGVSKYLEQGRLPTVANVGARAAASYRNAETDLENGGFKRTKQIVANEKLGVVPLLGPTTQAPQMLERALELVLK